MNGNFPALTVKRKTGDEPFQLDGRPTGFVLLNFWQWLASDLVDNALRGALAEFIVACDWGIADGTRPQRGWHLN